MNPIQYFRERYDESHCIMKWDVEALGVHFTFYHRCGEGCCSCSNEHFLSLEDPAWQEYEQFFIDNPHGDDYED